MFSSRLPETLAANAVSLAVARMRQQGAPLLDLTETNPTATGLSSPPEVLEALADPRGVRYEPAPLGLSVARAAVADEYVRQRTPVTADRIVLTASSSEAYAVLFKLLCDPGADVLVPQPSYPLFELLTRLEGVHARPYSLEYHGVWSIDRASLERALTPRTRAVLVVSPNNPTGSMLRRDDRDWLAGMCAARGIAIVSDEVFAAYPLSPRPDACSMIGESRALTFVLGGLSKSAGLPQVKLGWIAIGGPAPLVGCSLERLELICDTYLSVSTSVQLAASRLIDAGATMRAAIGARVGRNLERLREAVAARPAVSLLEPEGGWSAVLHVPATRTEDAIVMDLVERSHVLVNPGYFFDFPREAFLVVSLLPECRVFETAIDRMLPNVSGDAAS